MKRLLFLVALLTALGACAARPGEGPAWERDDPARRVYGGGV